MDNISLPIMEAKYCVHIFKMWVWVLVLLYSVGISGVPNPGSKLTYLRPNTPYRFLNNEGNPRHKPLRNKRSPRPSNDYHYNTMAHFMRNDPMSEGFSFGYNPKLYPYKTLSPSMGLPYFPSFNHNVMGFGSYSRNLFDKPKFSESEKHNENDPFHNDIPFSRSHNTGLDSMSPKTSSFNLFGAESAFPEPSSFMEMMGFGMGPLLNPPNDQNHARLEYPGVAKTGHSSRVSNFGSIFESFPSFGNTDRGGGTPNFDSTFPSFPNFGKKGHRGGGDIFGSTFRSFPSFSNNNGRRGRMSNFGSSIFGSFPSFGNIGMDGGHSSPDHGGKYGSYSQSSSMNMEYTNGKGRMERHGSSVVNDNGRVKKYTSRPQRRTYFNLDSMPMSDLSFI